MTDELSDHKAIDDLLMRATQRAAFSEKSGYLLATLRRLLIDEKWCVSDSKSGAVPQALEALQFAYGAILDAISEDGLDGNSCDRVLGMIRAALTANGQTPPEWLDADVAMPPEPIWSAGAVPPVPLDMCFHLLNSILEDKSAYQWHSAIRNTFSVVSAELAARPVVAPRDNARQVIEELLKDYADDCSKEACDRCEQCGPLVMCSFHSILSVLEGLTATNNLTLLRPVVAPRVPRETPEHEETKP